MRLKSALRRGVAAAVDNLKIDVSGKTEVDGSGDGASRKGEIVPDASSNPNHIIISGEAEVEAKAGASIGGKTAAIGGGIVGEIPNDALSNDDHKVTGGSLTRCDSDGKKMEDYSYDRRTPSQWEQPADTENSDDEDGSPDSLAGQPYHGPAAGAGRRPRAGRLYPDTAS